MIIKSDDKKTIIDDSSKIFKIKEYISIGFTEKEAIKKVALDLNLGKREVYNIYHRRDLDE